MSPSPPHYWIGVAARAHVQAGAAGGFIMFAHGRHDAIARVQPGDWFVYYSPTHIMGVPDSLRRFTAIGQVLPGAPMAAIMGAADTGWRRPARFIAGHDADIYPLLPQLAFVANPGHWGMYFRKSLFKVSGADFMVIAQAMGAGEQIGNGDAR